VAEPGNRLKRFKAWDGEALELVIDESRGHRNA